MKQIIKNYRKSSISIILIAITFHFGISCECYKLQPFLSNISTSTKICRIRIIDQFQFSHVEASKELTKKFYPKEYNDKNFPLLPFGIDSYTLVEVVEDFLENEKSDTLIFLNGDICGASLLYADDDMEFIIRYNPTFEKYNTERHEILRSKIISKKLLNYPFISTSDCINWHLNLTVKNSHVYGNIVTSRKAEALYNLHQESILDPLEYKRKIKEIRDLDEEIWTISKFRLKIEEIKETLYNKRR